MAVRAEHTAQGLITRSRVQQLRGCMRAARAEHLRGACPHLLPRQGAACRFPCCCPALFELRRAVALRMHVTGVHTQRALRSFGLVQQASLAAAVTLPACLEKLRGCRNGTGHKVHVRPHSQGVVGISRRKRR